MLSHRKLTALVTVWNRFRYVEQWTIDNLKPNDQTVCNLYIVSFRDEIALHNFFIFFFIWFNYFKWRMGQSSAWLDGYYKFYDKKKKNCRISRFINIAIFNQSIAHAKMSLWYLWFRKYSTHSFTSIIRIFQRKQEMKKNNKIK